MRRLESVTFLCTPNALNVVLTCPAGEKLEVVDFSASDDGTVQYSHLVFLGRGAGFFGLDEVVVAPPLFFAHRQYAGLVLNAGDTLVVLPAASVATPVDIVVGYVRVSPV